MKAILLNKFFIAGALFMITIFSVLTVMYVLREEVYLYEIIDDDYISITGYEGSKTHLVIPSKIEGLPVKEIGFEAFKDNSTLVSMVIPNSVTSIAQYAFNNATALESITFEEGSRLGNIGFYAFYGARALKSITIPSSVINIGMWAFAETDSLEEVIFEENSALTEIKTATFYYATALNSINIPESLIIIGLDAFFNAGSLTSIEIPDNVEIINGQAFFQATSLEEVIISQQSKLRMIGANAFSGTTALTSFYIPTGVVDVGEDQGIGKGAFAHTESMISYDVASDNGSYMSLNGVLYNKNMTTLIAYPANKTGESFVFPSSVQRVSAFAFSSAQNITELNVPATVQYIEESSFRNALLSSIYLRETVLSIGVNTFRNCDNLTIYTNRSSRPSGWYHEEEELEGGFILITSYNPDPRLVVFNHPIS